MFRFYGFLVVCGEFRLAVSQKIEDLERPLACKNINEELIFEKPWLALFNRCVAHGLKGIAALGYGAAFCSRPPTSGKTNLSLVFRTIRVRRPGRESGQTARICAFPFLVPT